MLSKKDRLKLFDDYEFLEDEEGNLLDREDYKDRLYRRWLHRASRQLGRIPEYRWLFGEDAPDWWTTDLIAQHMGVSKKTVYTWAKDIIGARPAEGKAGYRIPRSGLLIYLADLEDEELLEPPEEESEVKEAYDTAQVHEGKEG